jgi:hypothetical protein
MSGEMKVSRWRLPLVVGSLAVVAATGAVVVGTLIAHDQNARPSPAAFASQTASLSAAAAADPHGAKACELNDQAYFGEQLADDAVVLRISHEADQSKNPGIRVAASALVDQQVVAKSGKTADILDLMTTSIKLTTACVVAGFPPPIPSP